jgi:SAM-dependent methyltransferase
MGRSHTVHAVEAGAWNAGAAAWAERVRSHDWSAHDEAIRELIPPPQGVTLDVGCGEGRWTRALRAAGYDVSGFDRSDALIELARGADPHGRYHVAPVEALPVGDAEAQFVLCVNLLPHVDDLRGAVGELARVLPPGGVLVAGHRHPVAEAGSTDAETGELRRSARVPPTSNDRGLPPNVHQPRFPTRRHPRSSGRDRLDSGLPRSATDPPLSYGTST